jgi:hypothetical protein
MGLNMKEKQTAGGNIKSAVKAAKKGERSLLEDILRRLSVAGGWPPFNVPVAVNHWFAIPDKALRRRAPQQTPKADKPRAEGVVGDRPAIVRWLEHRRRRAAVRGESWRLAWIFELRLHPVYGNPPRPRRGFRREGFIPSCRH